MREILNNDNLYGLSKIFLILALSLFVVSVYQINVNYQIRSLETSVENSFSSTTQHTGSSNKLQTEQDVLKLNNHRIRDPEFLIILSLLCFCLQWLCLSKRQKRLLK